MTSDGPILVTGAAGFIGHHLCLRLLSDGARVIGVDRPGGTDLSEARLRRLRPFDGFSFEGLDLADRVGTAALLARVRPAVVLHLAARTGVRGRPEEAGEYVDSNLVAFANVLEGVREHRADLVFASSSSVYGDDPDVPWSEARRADAPISFYAATKRSNELMAHAYAQAYGVRATGLRFFTVYGPWGRPDMAPFLFARAIVEERPVHLYGGGALVRDFTYVDDAVSALVAAAYTPPDGTPPFRLYNVGAGRPTTVLAFLRQLEVALGKPALITSVEAPPVDVAQTFAANSRIWHALGWVPETPLDEGLARFAAWFHDWTR